MQCMELFCGWRWIRTTEGVSQQIYSLPHLATLVSTLEFLPWQSIQCKFRDFLHFVQEKL